MNSNRIELALLAIILPLVFVGCKKDTSFVRQAVSDASDKVIEYKNESRRGPAIVVLPGEIKSVNVDYTGRIGPNNIADFGEIELTRANFQVLERANLGAMLQEIEIAANLGDAEQLKKFRKGRFEATRWLVRFDILKAEPAVEVSRGFATRWGGSAATATAGPGGATRVGVTTGGAIGTKSASDSLGIWIVGVRFKVLDAVTGEQKSTGYFEDKMEVFVAATEIMGFTEAKTRRVTLDTMTQRLVQRCVVELDGMK